MSDISYNKISAMLGCNKPSRDRNIFYHIFGASSFIALFVSTFVVRQNNYVTNLIFPDNGQIPFFYKAIRSHATSYVNARLKLFTVFFKMHKCSILKRKKELNFQCNSSHFYMHQIC